ncbi:MAG: NAD(+)/NADH kinase [Lachnospiraceae bacterium]|nr:NAD(+)/NADH kinase [Lachnospiraceae bacterium]
MKNFVIIAKTVKEKEDRFLQDLCAYIKEKGASCSIVVEPTKESMEQVELPTGCDCILAIGGDGTVIRTAWRTFESGTPIVGVNRGHLGYLCDLDEDSVYDAIDQILAGKFEIENRMMLSGHLEREDGTIFTPEIPALNDIVISAASGLQVINLTVYINGQKLYSFNGDGVIFATPTGSTAYNLSANGPIVDPKTQLILLTPINAHSLNSRSFVLDPGDEISVEICRRRKSIEESAQVFFDGNHQQQLHLGERVVVYRAPDEAKMMKLSDMNFLERIRKKLQQD